MSHLKLHDVSVDYPIFDANSRRLLGPNSLPISVGGRIHAGRNNTIIVNALSGISFTAAAGDRIGLIGQNGSGKSTLLRVLAGIYFPTSGHIEREGTTACLLNLDMGMDVEESGYRNINLMGLLLGMRPREIQAITDEVAAFTDLGPYLELPVRTYSDGMKARLAFAIVTAQSPEILLIDEGIGAGDAAFQEKAKKRLDAFTGSAEIVVVATHSRDLIEGLCSRCILLHKGQLLYDGEVSEAFRCYDDVIQGRLDAPAPA